MSDGYDVVVVGAGIGGLTTASILAKNGMRVAVVEREDRVGGRALSIHGEEVGDRGADWYRGILGRHYCYLAYSDPGIDEMAAGRILDGYTIDLGYHGVPCAGLGYLGRLAEYVDTDFKVNPCDTGFYYKGEFYPEPEPSKRRLDDRIYRICKEKGIKYWSFVTSGYGLPPEELLELEKVSLYDYCERLGLLKDDTVWQSLRCWGTLFTTINNPHDISAGEIVRFANEVMAPLILAGKEFHVGGFTEGGIIKWSEAVAARFVELGGELLLNTEATQVVVEEGAVKGVRVTLPEGSGAFLQSARVVSGIPVQEIFGLVDADRFPADFVSRARALYGYGSLAPYFGLGELPIPGEQAGRLIKTPVVLPADGDYDYDVYMCWNVQSAIDPTCAPEGKHLLAAYLPLTERESREREKVMKLVEAVPRFFEEAYPGFGDCVEWAIYPMCWKLEGVAKSVSQTGTLKPEVEAPGIEGLYFSGDTARGFGVAMDCACSAGINCAAAVLGRDVGIE